MKMTSEYRARDWFEALHESSSPFKLVTEPQIPPDWPWPSVGTCLMPLLGADSNAARQKYVRLLGGRVSVFDAVPPDSGLRLMSVPVMYNGRSVTLTRVRQTLTENTGPMYGPNYSLLSKLLERSPTAVCIIAPESATITAFNRKFAELWNIESDAFQSWYGLDYSALFHHAELVSRSGTDAAAVLRLDGLSDRIERVLPLADGDAVRAVLDPVCVHGQVPYRVVASFSREEISYANRCREFTSAFRKLTHRQSEVVQHVASGRTNSEIARILGVGVKTVEKHRGMAIAKLNVDSVPELVRMFDFVQEADMGMY